MAPIDPFRKVRIKDLRGREDLGVKTKTDFGYKANDRWYNRMEAIEILAEHLAKENSSIYIYLYRFHIPGSYTDAKIEKLVKNLNSDHKVENALLDDLIFIANKDYDQRVRGLASYLVNRYWECLRLYKENTDGFIKYFSNINDDEKKDALRKILDCDFENRKVDSWLDEHYLQLVREVGLEP